ncbi:hypothetical protein JTB14_005765 [Gonioctena quinquepunctata]|nr:hypothetical protein JTB14_005765 [Gonioctena quinquepunctata]
MKVDNQSAINLADNPEFHKRTKHIKYHFVREASENGVVKIDYVESNLQLADILTKPLTKEKISSVRTQLKIQNLNEMRGV